MPLFSARRLFSWSKQRKGFTGFNKTRLSACRLPRTHPVLFISQVWHGADAEADDGHQHHDDREAGEHLPRQPRLRVFHHLPQHTGQPSKALLSLCVGLRQ